jgi:hypothetical protein
VSASERAKETKKENAPNPNQRWETCGGAHAHTNIKKTQTHTQKKSQTKKKTHTPKKQNTKTAFFKATKSTCEIFCRPG